MISAWVLIHVSAVLGALFCGFLCAFAVLRARERRHPGLPRWTGPISLAWALTVLFAAFLIVFTMAGWRLAGSVDVGNLTLGEGLLQVSVILFPAFTAAAWAGLLREARRRPPSPGRHSPTAFVGLLLAAGALAVLVAKAIGTR